jgi:hypothetical protein
LHPYIQNPSSHVEAPHLLLSFSTIDSPGKKATVRTDGRLKVDLTNGRVEGGENGSGEREGARGQEEGSGGLKVIDLTDIETKWEFGTTKHLDEVVPGIVPLSQSTDSFEALQWITNDVVQTDQMSRETPQPDEPDLSDVETPQWIQDDSVQTGYLPTNNCPQPTSFQSSPNALNSPVLTNEVSVIHAKELPTLQVHLDHALTNFEFDISPWKHPAQWIKADSLHVNFIVEDLAALTKNKDIKQIVSIDPLFLYPVSCDSDCPWYINLCSYYSV